MISKNFTGGSMKFKDIRKKFGTQEEFSKMIAVARTTVTKWEKGNCYPKREQLIRLEKITGIDRGEILRAIDNSKKQEQL